MYKIKYQLNLFTDSILGIRIYNLYFYLIQSNRLDGTEDQI